MLVHVVLYSTCSMYMYMYMSTYLPVHLMLVHVLYSTCTQVLTCPSDACTYTTITPVCSSIVLTGLDIIGGYDPVDIFTITLCICIIDIYSQWCGTILCTK